MLLGLHSVEPWEKLERKLGEAGVHNQAVAVPLLPVVLGDSWHGKRAAGLVWEGWRGSLWHGSVAYCSSLGLCNQLCHAMRQG